MRVKDITHSLQTIPFEEVVLLHTAGAIAYHSNLIDEVNQEYEENKKEYMDAYRNSIYYRHIFVTGFPIEMNIRMQKVLAMYVYHEEQDGTRRDFMIKYILSGYKRVYDYVEHNQTLSFTSLANLYMSSQVNHTTDTMLTLISGIALYLGYETHSVTMDAPFHVSLNNLITFYGSLAERDNIYNEELQKNELESLRVYKDILGFKTGKEIMLDAMLAKHENYLVKTFFNKDELRRYLNKGETNLLYTRGLYRYWKPLTAILRLSGLNEMNFLDVDITRKDLVSIYTIFTISKEQGRLKEEELEFMIAGSLLALMMSKHYLSLQDSIQNQFEKDSGIETLQVEDKINEELLERREKEKEFLKREAEYLLKIKAQEEELDRLQKALKSTETTNKEFDKLKKEVVALREFTFSETSQQEDEYEEDNDALTENIQLLKDKRITVIGGHENFHLRLKKLLPNIRTVKAEEKGIDLSFIRNMDILCIVTTYVNHSQSERAIASMNSENTQLVYINNKKNVELVIKKLADL